MKTNDFDYNLPEELIAQIPIIDRSGSRLLVLDKATGLVEHHQFSDITTYLRKGDVLVFNNSRVIPARLFGKRKDTGGKVEILLLRKMNDGTWQALVKPGKRIRTGALVEIADEEHGKTVTAEAVGIGEDGTRFIRFSDESLLPDMGEIPLPPYIHEPLRDPERYQTVYSKPQGSAAAPTAGLHFTAGMLEEIQSSGIECLFPTLHIGLDTFRPVKEDDPAEHLIHKEFGIVPEDIANRINLAKKGGRRVICVGTTSVRLIEAAASRSDDGTIQPFSDWIDLYILPGFTFKIVDAMLTNFHLPRSTLIMMVSAFAGPENIRNAYRQAVEERYRFYSFGDAMFIK